MDPMPPASTGGPSGDSTAGSPDPSESDGSADSSSGSPPTACEEPGVWCPQPGTTWQWQLVGEVDPTGAAVEMFDLDLFDVPMATMAALQGQGVTVVCYFSAGSHEDWRPDADDFPPTAIGNPLGEWPGEHWLDIRDPGVRQVLAARLDLAAQKGCDAVEPDNVDGYTNDPGFPLTGDDQLDFNRWLAAEAHARGLSVGLKNDLDQLEALLPHFDWALNEECMVYDECDRLDVFIDAGKAVFHTEYVDDAAQGRGLAATVCPDAQARSFSTLIKEWDLTEWGIACQ